MIVASKVEYRFIPIYHKDVSGMAEISLQKEWSRHWSVYDEIKENQMYTVDGIRSTIKESAWKDLIKNEYNFQIEIINRNPFMLDGYALVNLNINYCNMPIGFYMKNETLNMLIDYSYRHSIFKPWSIKN